MTNILEENLPKPASLVYAQLYQRLAAFAVDLIVIYGTAMSFSLGLGVINDRSWIMLFALFFSWIYLTVFYYKGKGQTVGCKVFGIKVTSIEGSELGFWRAVFRGGLVSGIVSPLGLISLLAVSFILVSLLSLNLKPTKQKRQTFWDVGTKTCVIKGGVKLKWDEW